MEKLTPNSPDLAQQNIDKLAELFPNVVTETKDEAGVRRAVDFDLLRQELSDHVVEGPQERYQLNWPGKRQALLTANAPIAKTLRPVREESVDFDNTQNLFIEGDNLDALKLLQESYLGKVKLIYIDPPYNTGKDFIYNDDFSETNSEYLRRSEQINEKGDRLTSSPESSGRFHSDWLSMMYPRLKLARNLLADDGLIFISLDDGEISNLRHLCDEVFGAQQFIAHLIWKKRNTPPNDRAMGAQHDFMLVYGKQGIQGIQLRPRSDAQIARYKNPDDHPKGPWVAGDLTANVKGGRYVESLNFPITNPQTGEQHWPSANGNWRFNEDRVKGMIARDEIYFGKDGSRAPKVKRFLKDVKPGTTWTTLWDFAPLNAKGSQEMGELFGNASMFESPKPVGLMQHVLEAGSDKDCIVLDFFGGSASMAHAVIAQNAADGGRRRFILIQLDEACGPDSEPGKAGFSTISQLSKERIRRVSNSMQDTASLATQKLDYGFRSLKVDFSNFCDVHAPADEVGQTNLLGDSDNLRSDRANDALLFECMIAWGLDLSLPISTEEFDEHIILNVDDGLLMACFDDLVDSALVRELARREPLRAVFRDSSFGSDADRINAEQIFKELSSATDVKVI